jgi:hypothetical protein
MKHAAEEKWELPEALRLTPEALAEADRRDREAVARGQSPYASHSPRDFERLRALRAVEDLTAQLRHVERQMGAVFTSRGCENFEGLRDAQKAVWTQLAEAHAATGRYDLAARFEPDRRRRAECLRIWRAVLRDDSHWCGCPPQTSGLPQAFIKAEVWLVREGRWGHLVKCAGCKCLNVTTRADVLGPLLAQRSHRAAAAQIVAGMKPGEARRALKGAGHTTEALLK